MDYIRCAGVKRLSQMFSRDFASSKLEENVNNAVW